MRTLDPETWSKIVRKPPLKLSRPMRFGKRPLVAAESRLRRSFQDAMKEYWVNCSVDGVRHITNGHKAACVKYSYSVAILLLFFCGVFTVILSACASRSSEQSTVDQRNGLSIQDVPFPAVGLCSNNVISRRALLQYTLTLVASGARNKTYDASMVARNLAQLGHLLTMTVPQDHVDISFMGYLASVDPRARISTLMLRFAPKCSGMLVRCSWRGETRPCEELFQTMVTPLGYCCVFNSRYQPQDVYKLPKFLDMVGEEYGLSVVVKQDIEDFTFFRRPSHDIDVLIFDGGDYPLLEGGGARVYPVPGEGNASTYLTLSAIAHYPKQGFYRDIETLRCRSRRVSGPRARRSRAWCLAECRRRTLAALCECRLHTAPAPAPSAGERRKHIEECSLTHLACLNKNREKFLYYQPRGPVLLEQELQNAQQCADCAPDCARVAYSAAPAAASQRRDKLFRAHLLQDLPLENVTTIRLFYSSRQLKSYVFDANYRWYENFAQYGSAWALIVGASVMSVSELLFHCILRWRHHYRQRTRLANSHV